MIGCLLISTMTLPGITEASQAQNPLSNGKMKIIRNSSSYRGPKLQFVEVTGGYGSGQSLLRLDFKKLETLYTVVLNTETHSPISFGIGGISHTDFKRGGLTLQNQHAIAFGKYRFSHTLSGSSAIEVYGMGGVNTWQSKLDNTEENVTEFSIPGGQKDTGVGMLLGAGVNYRYRGVGIGGQFLWLTGKGNYQLADESAVGVLTGSMQAT